MNSSAVKLHTSLKAGGPFVSTKIVDSSKNCLNVSFCKADFATVTCLNQFSASLKSILSIPEDAEDEDDDDDEDAGAS